MAAQAPDLPTLDELAQGFQALEDQRVGNIRLLASCWNSELVAEALGNAIYALYQMQRRVDAADLLSADEYAESFPTFQSNGLRDSETMKTLIEYQPHGNKCYWDCGLVPGALELPLAAKWSAEQLHSDQKQPQYHGILAIGVVIRGETAHFDLVSRECAAGLSAVALQSGTPVISGLVAADNEQQAKERVGQAENWVRSLLQMMLLRRQTPQ